MGIAWGRGRGRGNELETVWGGGVMCRALQAEPLLHTRRWGLSALGSCMQCGLSEQSLIPYYGHRHALVVFGGVLFDLYVNTCPGQGSRTIRTEVSPVSPSASPL